MKTHFRKEQSPQNKQCGGSFLPIEICDIKRTFISSSFPWLEGQNSAHSFGHFMPAYELYVKKMYGSHMVLSLAFSLAKPGSTVIF
jgi:hypothetical protein